MTSGEKILKARVVGEGQGLYRVKNEEGEYLARVMGKTMHRARSRQDYPVVGDWVVIGNVDDDRATIESILPRKTVLRRRKGNKEKENKISEEQIIAANVDVAFLVGSVDRDFNMNRWERYLAIVADSGVKPVIVLNKIDLVSDEKLSELRDDLAGRFGDIEIIFTSIESDNGMKDLKEGIVEGKTYCFLGSSGVGKSSIINKLLADDLIDTREVSDSTGRGKHTTTSRDLYALPNGAMVIDNPGIREVGMLDMAEGIDNVFGEIDQESKQCKYRDCTHTHEPGCRVIAALEEGRIDEDRYDNYVKLKKEAEYYDMSDRQRKQKKKRLGKMIKEYKKRYRRK